MVLQSRPISWLSWSTRNAVLAGDHGNSYTAINALRDAYHLREWIWHDRLEHDPRLQIAIMTNARSESDWKNMTRLGSWRFLELGRRIERAIVTCRFVRQFGARPDRSLDILLQLCDSRITYRQRYVMVAARAPVIDLTLLDPSNPRSVAFQFDQIEHHLTAMPHMRPDGRLSLPRQISMATVVRLRTAEAARVDDRLILSVENALMHLSEAISSTYLGRNEPIETREDLPS